MLIMFPTYHTMQNTNISAYNFLQNQFIDNLVNLCTTYIIG